MTAVDDDVGVPTADDDCVARLGDMMGVVGTLEGEASGFCGEEVGHFGIGGRFADGGPMASAGVDGGVGVEF